MEQFMEGKASNCRGGRSVVSDDGASGLSCVARQRTATPSE